jgi:hypothetical protein
MSDTDIDNDNEVNDVYDNERNYELARGVVADVLGDKPANAMDKVNDIMLDKVRDAIAGKRLEVAHNLMDPEPQQELEPEIEDEDEYVDDLETEQETEEEDENIQGDQ